MRRILPAVLIAILLHVLLFAMDTDWLNKENRGKIKIPAITVTMSYKKVDPPQVKTPPEKIKKKKKVKISEKIKRAVPVKVNKKVLPVKKEIIENITTESRVEEIIEEAVPAEEPDEVQEVIEESVSVVITEAIPLYKINPEPLYPRIARKRGYEGTVLLSVLVNENGLVDNIWVFESCGYRILDNAALEAVKDWTFEPGRRGDDAVEMWVEVPVRFELE